MALALYWKILYGEQIHNCNKVSFFNKLTNKSPILSGNRLSSREAGYAAANQAIPIGQAKKNMLQLLAFIHPSSFSLTDSQMYLQQLLSFAEERQRKSTCLCRLLTTFGRKNEGYEGCHFVAVFKAGPGFKDTLEAFDDFNNKQK